MATRPTPTHSSVRIQSNLASTLPNIPLTPHATEADDKEAINKDNMINERTRGAAKSSGTYQEPSDEEGLPGPEDGTSRLTGNVGDTV